MGWVRRALALCAAAVLGLAGAVSGHAYMTKPVTRNFAYSAEGKMGGTFNCVSCLASGGPATLYGGAGNQNNYPRKVVDKFPVCGGSKEHGGVNDFQFDNDGPVERWLRGKGWHPPSFAPGSVIEIVVVVQHYHFGLFRFGLCGYDEVSRLGAGGAKGKERRPVDDCFERGALTNAAPQAAGDPHAKRMYIGADASLTSRSKTYTARFKLPANPGCTRCVLLFHYVTGNTCTPAGTPAQFADTRLPVCGAKGSAPPEEFWNCADITIAGGGGNTTSHPKTRRREAYQDFAAVDDFADWLRRLGPMTPAELMGHLLGANLLIALFAPRFGTAVALLIAHAAALAWWAAARRRQDAEEARELAATIPSPPRHRVEPRTESFRVQELPLEALKKSPA